MEGQSQKEETTNPSRSEQSKLYRCTLPSRDGLTFEWLLTGWGFETRDRVCGAVETSIKAVGDERSVFPILVSMGPGRSIVVGRTWRLVWTEAVLPASVSPELVPLVASGYSLGGCFWHGGMVGLHVPLNH